MTEIQLLSQKEKAKELHISNRTIARWIEMGKISFIKIKSSKRKWFLPLQNRKEDI